MNVTSPRYVYTGMDAFTVEHVRVLVDQRDAQAVALALVAGIVPFRPMKPGLDDAMAWFGGSLSPYESGFRAGTSPVRLRYMQNAINRLGHETNQVPVCVLDLVRVRHTAAAREGENGGDTLCGAATLSFDLNTVAPRVSLRGTDVTTGQFHATFSANNTAHPNRAIHALSRALGVEDDEPESTVPLDRIIGGRDGVESGLKVSKAKTIAKYEPDVASIWTLKPDVPGHNIIFDTFHAEYDNAPVYRVFKASSA